jgi:hypothetical protein
MRSPSTQNRDRAEVLLLELVAELERDVDSFLVAFQVRISSIPAFQHIRPSAKLSDAVGLGLTAVVRDVLARLRLSHDLPGELPPDAAIVAKRWARQGLGLTSIAEAQTAAQQLFWERFFSEAETLVDEAGMRWEVMKLAFERINGYNRRLNQLFILEHRRESRTIAAREASCSERLVVEVLEGSRVESDVLGYDLDAWHVAAVADASAQLVFDVLPRSGFRTLTVPRPGDITWAWFSRAGRPSMADVDTLVDRIGTTSGRLGFGELAVGVDGFRRSHRQALEAWSLTSVGQHPVVRYADVALPALALTDLEWARALVARELGPVGGPGPDAATRRDTLRAFLGLGCNASSAAATLGCHRDTVASRVASVEQYRGRTVSDRIADLDLALRLADLGVHPG